MAESVDGLAFAKVGPMTEHVLVPIAVVLAMLAGTVLPVMRSMRKQGETGLTIHRRTSVAQRIVGAIVGVLGAAAIPWAFLVATDRVALWSRSVALATLGWTTYALGIVVIVLAQAQMGRAWRIGIDDKPTSLVTTGLYARVRNPIYLGVILVGLGLAALTPSPWTIASAIAYAVMIRAQVAFEESHLLALHGEAYRDYVTRVGRFLPKIGASS
jgi:protein-S-isoprenylcysteine O-methyltransferase Ste14